MCPAFVFLLGMALGTGWGFVLGLGYDGKSKMGPRIFDGTYNPPRPEKVPELPRQRVIPPKP